MREKYQRQQVIIDKIVRFLASFFTSKKNVQSSKRPLLLPSSNDVKYPRESSINEIKSPDVASIVSLSPKNVTIETPTTPLGFDNIKSEEKEDIIKTIEEINDNEGAKSMDLVKLKNNNKTNNVKNQAQLLLNSMYDSNTDNTLLGSGDTNTNNLMQYIEKMPINGNSIVGNDIDTLTNPIISNTNRLESLSNDINKLQTNIDNITSTFGIESNFDVDEILKNYGDPSYILNNSSPEDREKLLSMLESVNNDSTGLDLSSSLLNNNAFNTNLSSAAINNKINSLIVPPVNGNASTNTNTLTTTAINKPNNKKLKLSTKITHAPTPTPTPTIANPTNPLIDQKLINNIISLNSSNNTTPASSTTTSPTTSLPIVPVVKPDLSMLLPSASSGLLSKSLGTGKASITEPDKTLSNKANLLPATITSLTNPTTAATAAILAGSGTTSATPSLNASTLASLIGNPVYAQAFKNMNLSNPLLNQSLLNSLNISNPSELSSLLALQGNDINSLLLGATTNSNPNATITNAANAALTTGTGLNLNPALANSLKLNNAAAVAAAASNVLPSTTTLNFNAINNPATNNLEQLLALSQMINPTASSSIPSTLDTNNSILSNNTTLLDNKLTNTTPPTAATASNTEAAAITNPYMYLNSSDPSLLNLLANSNSTNNLTSSNFNLTPSSTTTTTTTTNNVTTTVKPADLMPGFMSDTIKSTMNSDNSVTSSSSSSITKPTTTTTGTTTATTLSSTSIKTELPLSTNLFK